MPAGAAHQSASRPSPWWSSRYITNVFLSRMKNVGEPWLSRSLVSGSARQSARTRSRGVERTCGRDASAPILFNGGMNLRAGVDLGGTKIQAVVVDERFSVLGAGAPADPDQGRAGRRRGGDRRGDARAPRRPPRPSRPSSSSIGVGSPGDVDDAERAPSRPPATCPNWEGSFPLAGALQDELGPRVSLGNDVNVATMAEATLGAGTPYQSMLGVFWGTGVGGGVVLDGKLWLGRDAAGEIGHMVVKIGGAKCPCGRQGCMEAYAGRAAMETARARAREEGRADRPLRDHGEARPRPARRAASGRARSCARTRWRCG